MRKFYKNIAILTTSFALIAGFTYAGLGSNISTVTTKNEPTKINNKSLTSNKILTSSNIIVYTSQPYESYTNGKKIIDIGNSLNSKIKEKGINSTFISNVIIKKYPQSNKEYINHFDVTRKFITQNVKDYKDSVLLNITRNDFPEKNILIALSKSSPYYVENKKFADSLVQQFNKLNQPVKIIYYQSGINYLNQDLSNKSILIGIGNNQANDSELNQIVDTVATALKNVQKK